MCKIYPSTSAMPEMTLHMLEMYIQMESLPLKDNLLSLQS